MHKFKTKNGVDVFIEILSPCAIAVKTNLFTLTPLTEGPLKTITELRLFNECTFKIGDELQLPREGTILESTHNIHRPVPFKIASIKETNATLRECGYSNIILSRKPTLSNIFVLPTIEGFKSFNELAYPTFINSYLKFDNSGIKNAEFGEFIYLVYFYSSNFAEAEAAIINTEGYVDTILLDNSDLIVFKFKCSDKYSEDLKLIVQSKYSRISSALKSRILRFHSYTKGGTVGSILYRNPKRKQELEALIGESLPDTAEFLSSIYEEDETFTI